MHSILFESLIVHYNIIKLSSVFAGDVITGVKNYEIILKEKKNLLKEIKNKLSRIKLQLENGFENREYKLNKALFNKIK